jgi:uridine kinase
LPDIDRNILFKIYLSALFELNIDLTNRVSATDVRFIRRLIRGKLSRGTGPELSIDFWPNVRKAETEKIFIFTEEADVMFNSSLLYEVNAQRTFAEELLNQIPDGSPYQPVRDRFLTLLSFFQPMDTSKIPQNSIIREFIGGSIYFDQE